MDRTSSGNQQIIKRKSSVIAKEEVGGIKSRAVEGEGGTGLEINNLQADVGEEGDGSEFRKWTPLSLYNLWPSLGTPAYWLSQ